MNQEGFKRKLTAVLSADAVGYSRLMAEDEAATVKTIATYREIMSSLIKQHRGRVVDSPGDNVLAEFSSVVDAVQCAVAVQNEFQARNAELAENRRMKFRIGINLGDVIDEEDRIYGDGVNIAARLEALADAGGICVSKTAFDQIETKLPLGYEYLGEQSVKNIPKPVGAYRVLMNPDAAGKVIGEKRFLGRYSRRTAMAAITILIAVAVGLISWNIYLQQSKRVEPASLDRMAYPLPEKPSIAVLPFENLSGDSSHEFFSDGLTEEIITILSKSPKIFVIARNSTDPYKNRSIKIQKVSEELAVRYVLEGSIRKDGNRTRITVQLIDAIKGHHLWAERYDRDLKDTFAVQEEISKKILTALEVNLTEGEQATMMAKGTSNGEAYIKVLQSTYYRRRLNAEDNAKARRLAEEAIAMDPEYAFAYTTLSRTHVVDVWLRTTKSPRESFTTAMDLANKALSIDDSLADAYDILGNILVLKRNYDQGINHLERAIELEPNGADFQAHMGMALNLADRSQEAIQVLLKAIRLNPNPPSWYLHNLAASYNFVENYDEAIFWGEKAVKLNPKNLLGHYILCAIYSSADRMEDAKREALEVLKINPKFSVSKVEKTNPLKNESVKKRYFDSLRKAGLPE
ncbi:MAG TPA: adenylate/guanylate cyclase domain-containing protein [Balneolales bacterium]|nr:adenylate/guanylate cyclase domain-containing protein [Balneolales bacterium]